MGAVREAFQRESRQVLYWFLVRQIIGIPGGTKARIWMVAGKVISGMYKDVIKAREGVG